MKILREYVESGVLFLCDGDTLDIKHCVSVRYWFDIFIYGNTIIIVALADTSVMSHNYFFFFFVVDISDLVS